MKSILVFFFTILAIHSNAQNKNFLAGTIWQTNLIVGKTDADSYTLTKTDNDFLQFGQFIEFSDSLNFRSFNRAMCGNDCFVSVIGKYDFIDSNIISILTLNISYSGFCYDNNKTEKLHKVNYSIKINNETIELKKIE